MFSCNALRGFEEYLHCSVSVNFSSTRCKKNYEALLFVVSWFRPQCLFFGVVVMISYSCLNFIFSTEKIKYNYHVSFSL